MCMKLERFKLLLIIASIYFLIVNTAARIESLGSAGCIHLSQEAADEIASCGKRMWISERPDKVSAKGKGELNTFWLSLESHSSVGDARSVGDASCELTSDCSERAERAIAGNHEEKKSSLNSPNPADRTLTAKDARLVAWNVDILQRLLKQIAAKKKSQPIYRREKSFGVDQNEEGAKPKMVLDEVREVIHLPKFTSKAAGVSVKAEGITLPPEVVTQLRDYVTDIAAMYNDNPFHSFEHARYEHLISFIRQSNRFK